MGLIDRMLGRETEKRTGPFVSAANYPSPDSYVASGSRAHAGVVVNERSALSHSVVYSSARLLADGVSALPMYAYDEKPDGTIAKSATQPEIITDPFAEMTCQSGLFSVVISQALRGNSFCVVIDRDPVGFATKLLVVHPDWVRVERDIETGLLRYHVNNVEVAPEDIIHTPTFVIPGNPMGLSPIEAAGGTVALGIAQGQFSQRFFEAGATLSGVIESPENLDDAKAARLAKVFAAKHGGVKRSHAVGILTGGAKFTPIQMTNEASQLLESRTFSATELSMLMGVSPDMLGLPGVQTFAGAGLETQGRRFVTYSLLPYIRRIEGMFTRLLPPGQVAKIDVDELISADRKGRYEANHLALSDGWKNLNEVRAEEGLPPIPGGDVYMRPLYLGQAGTQENPNNTTPTAPSGATQEDAA